MKKAVLSLSIIWLGVGGSGLFAVAAPEDQELALAWKAMLTPLFPIIPPSPGTPVWKVPPPLVGEAHYRFGWSKMSAASASLKFSRAPARAGRPATARLDLTAATVGAVRKLWRLDAHAFAVADAATLLPIRSRQWEQTRKRTVISAVEFYPKGVIQGRGRITGAMPPGFYDDAWVEREQLGTMIGERPKRLKWLGLLDLHTALLRLRAQPLVAGDEIRWLVFHDFYPYLATVTVIGPEAVAFRSGGKAPAIKVKLALQWVDRDGQLQAHRRFKGATCWFSDDAMRLPVKIESELFVGSVWAELERFTPLL